jgi:Trp operon repressor
MVLNSLLGTVELDVIARRLEIVRLLAKGESYATIKKDLHVSSATISSLAEAPNEKGWQKALFKLHINDWAEGILSFFEKMWYGPSKERTAQ